MGSIIRLKLTLVSLLSMTIAAMVPWVLYRIPLLSSTGPVFWLVVFIVIFGLSVLSYFTIIPHLVANIGGLSSITEQISHGDLSHVPQTVRPTIFPDEVDQLTNGISQMVTQLRELVTHIQTTALSLSGNAKTLSGNAQAVDNFSGEVAASMTKITDGARLQAQLALDASNMIIQIAAGQELTTCSADNAAAVSRETLQAATSGSQTAKIAIDKLRLGFEQMQSSICQVYDLTNGLEQIGNIVEIITKVANQTNMLALNATIEAARAGEYGRGFTVVAEEIRKLAENTSAGVDQIAALINQFKEQAQGATSAIRESTKELTASRDEMNAILTALADIQVAAQKGVAMVTDISKISRNQLEGAKDMVEAISRIAELAVGNDQSTAQVNTATKKQIVSVKELTDRSTELARLAQELQLVISRFKLDSDET